MYKKIRFNLKKRLRSQEGSMLIEYVIGMLVFIVFVAFCLDVVFVGHKHYYIGQEMANVARTISVQSGAEQVTPTGFTGGNKSYQTSGKILNRMEKVAKVAGFKDGEWELYVEETDQNGKVVRKGILTEKSNFKADYLNKVSVEFRGKYRWDVLASGVPGINSERELKIKRIAMAEYLRNYD